MSENTKKKKESYNEVALDVLVARYGVTKTFIRMSLRGDRDSAVSESIKKEYPALAATAEADRKAFLNQNAKKQAK